MLLIFDDHTRYERKEECSNRRRSITIVWHDTTNKSWKQEKQICDLGVEEVRWVE